MEHLKKYIKTISEELAIQAHRGVSFNPEQRGTQYIAEYDNDLKTALEILVSDAESGQTQELVESLFQRLCEGYHKRYMAMLQSKARTLSPMITGMGNFPVARNKKRIDVYMTRVEELASYYKWFLEKAKRDLRPDLKPIMRGDDDAVERLESKLQGLIEYNESAVLWNKIIRKTPITLENINQYKASYPGKKDHLDYVEQCLHRGYYAGKLGTCGSEISDLKKRIAFVKKCKETPVSQVSLEGLKIEDDAVANRVKIYFEAIPSEEKRKALKSNGFRWSPTNKAWQAYRNQKAFSFVEKIRTGAI